MKRIVMMLVVCGVVVGAFARRMLRARRDRDDAAELELEIERFENEGGRIAPM